MYGRTKGRRLSKKQKLFLRNHGKDLIFDDGKMEEFLYETFGPKENIFDNKKVYLEIGFGSGEHLAHKAERHKESKFIGCDYYLNGIASTVIKITEKELSNVSLFNGDAIKLLNKIPNKSLYEVYLLYPDPWPKVRHLKRRFISDQNLRLLASKLIDGGALKVVTDSDIYFTHIKSVVLTQKISKIFSFKGADFSQPWKDWYSTKYEEKAKKAGRRSYYMVLKKIIVNSHI